MRVWFLLGFFHGESMVSSSWFVANRKINSQEHKFQQSKIRCTAVILLPQSKPISQNVGLLFFSEASFWFSLAFGWLKTSSFSSSWITNPLHQWHLLWQRKEKGKTKWLFITCHAVQSLEKYWTNKSKNSFQRITQSAVNKLSAWCYRRNLKSTPAQPLENLTIIFEQYPPPAIWFLSFAGILSDQNPHRLTRSIVFTGHQYSGYSSKSGQVISQLVIRSVHSIRVHTRGIYLYPGVNPVCWITPLIDRLDGCSTSKGEINQLPFSGLISTLHSIPP